MKSCWKKGCLIYCILAVPGLLMMYGVYYIMSNHSDERVKNEVQDSIMTDEVQTAPFGSNTLLSRDYEKCKDEASVAKIIEKEGFPETNDDNALRFGTYSYRAEVKGETHSMSYQFEPYEGENKMIVAKISCFSDGKQMMRGFVGYCGSSVYATFLREMDRTPYEDDRIQLNSPYTGDYIYANPDGSISLYFDGSEKIRMKLGEVETVKFD